MKSEIHPKYHSDCKVTCACGNAFVTGSTVPSLHIEICGNCHPFYTGKQKLVDTAKRVDKFMQKMDKKTKIASTAKPKKVRKSSKAEAAPVVAKTKKAEAPVAETKTPEATPAK